MMIEVKKRVNIDHGCNIKIDCVRIGSIDECFLVKIIIWHPSISGGVYGLLQTFCLCMVGPC